MRTTPDLVRAAINAPISNDVDVAGFIRTANKLTDHIVSEDSGNILTPAGLDVEVETYLACYFLALRYQQYSQKSTGDASASFQTGQRGPGRFEANDWGLAAMAADVTGLLNQLNTGVKKVELVWLGTPYTQQTRWWERD